MAEIFLPTFAKVILNVPVFRKAFMSKIAPSGIYEYVTARTKVFDEIFLDALGKRVAQIILLSLRIDFSKRKMVVFRDRSMVHTASYKLRLTE